MKRGFTLAEILITLGVIGVVASLTLASVIKTYQKQVTVSKLKKAYTTTAQAFQLSIEENGNIPEEMYGTDYHPENFYNTYVKPYYKIIKYCEPGNKCGYKGNYPFTYLNDTECPFYFSRLANFSFIGADGIMYIFQPYYGNIDFFIDINGTKPPNKYGKDFFGMNYDKNNKQFFPKSNHSTDNDLNLNCSKNGKGSACLEKIRRAGWKIEDDYPW